MVASGTGVGARSRLVHSVQGVSYFIRVVARDGHGNATTSAERPVTVPLDDASAGTYEGTWGNNAGRDAVPEYAAHDVGPRCRVHPKLPRLLRRLDRARRRSENGHGHD
jgi:hypothetical protein